MADKSAEVTEVLLPCPFCGGNPVMRKTVEEYPADGEFAAGEYEAWCDVCCDTCGIKKGDEYRGEAVASWNARVVLPEATIRTLELVEDQIANGNTDNALDLIRAFQAEAQS